MNALPEKPPGGHVFVVRGDLTTIQCDARIVPAVFDGAAPRAANWYLDGEREHALAAPVPPDWEPTSEALETRRTYRIAPYPGQPRSPTLWVTKVGLRDPDDLEFAMQSAREFLERAADDAIAKRSQAARSDRLLPLIAMHIPASGGENAKIRLGVLVRRVLETAEAFVREYPADVVLVAKTQAHYDALQSLRQQRGKSAWPALRSEDLELAKALARKRLSIFVGAGVSKAVGLPDWWSLLSRIATQLGMQSEIVDRGQTTTPSGSPMLTAAARIEARDKKRFRELIVEQCSHPRAGLGHFLLTNLPANHYVTLNYDTLLEQAAETGGRSLDVLPRILRTDGRVRDRWIMKLHGCTNNPEEIVITPADYDRFAEHRLAFNGLVQGLLLTEHMLFVGFGLEDPNVENLVAGLERAITDARVPSTQRFGTVLRVGSAPTTLRRAQYDWHKYFHIYDLYADGDEGVLPSAHRSEIFLDALAAYSADPFAHLLDRDFDALFDDDERAIRELATDFAERLRCMSAVKARERILETLWALGLRRDG